jgi:hypothetical protein
MYGQLNFQLRIGHITVLLNDYLFRFKRVDSANCPACRDVRETAEHLIDLILYCPSYARSDGPCSVISVAVSLRYRIYVSIEP